MTGLVRRALAMGGKCTGEHGIGIGKQQFLLMEAGEGGVALMRKIKQALDSANILNPCKILASRWLTRSGDLRDGCRTDNSGEGRRHIGLDAAN